MGGAEMNMREKMAQAMTKEMVPYLDSDVIYSDDPVIDAILDVLRDIPDTTIILNSTEPVSIGAVWRATFDTIKAGK